MTQSARAQDLVFTLFGEYLLHRSGPVWVGSLIRLLGALGWSPAATRTVLSRMSRHGWLTAAAKRGHYALSGRARRLLEEGETRIYHPPRGQAWDGWWHLVAYSIPEEERARRDRLRVRLQWLGFGQLGNGLWISPHPLRDQIGGLAQALGVRDHMEIFRAQHLGFSDVSQLVAYCWDLPAIGLRYRAFMARHERAYGRAHALVSRGALKPRDAFVRRFRLVHAYREFPLVDPYLPAALLPADWPGAAAAKLFEDYHELLTESAEAFVTAALAPANLRRGAVV
ncbi:MAG TPA: PaaX family transcriptional regulator C-terminal domain-containing protein [Longimicrobiales bacterium]|nr:PaaX family transcriptional regulator C-terminal domain-containing protein [Longimicrobiales bacterium]